jgi:hypothetical protein
MQLQQEASMFHTTTSKSQTAGGVHITVESNTCHIPHRLKIPKKSNYLADKRPAFPQIPRFPAYWKKIGLWERTTRCLHTESSVRTHESLYPLAAPGSVQKAAVVDPRRVVTGRPRLAGWLQ